ncbi:hypothetical protein D9758_002558 [Tetrapyrgos nigripes]|uniref:Uncharacterized protein n=1 Tax=Tetrapyrgos nigripes TaxID=182062 RepID=A0A8H5GRA4_9AGAR|nr:hypothetical protein D9758_002558 [Tetrapyrgos nigripes]
MSIILNSLNYRESLRERANLPQESGKLVQLSPLGESLRLRSDSNQPSPLRGSVQKDSVYHKVYSSSNFSSALPSTISPTFNQSPLGVKNFTSAI